MCGRFALGLARNQIQRVHGRPDVEVDEWVDENRFVPRYNIAPHSLAPVLRRREGGGRSQVDADNGHSGPSGLFLQTMRWGLVPHWAKHEDKTLNTINARSEILVQGGGMWGSIKGKKRCVVLAQGYYEWQKKGKERIPFFTKHKDDKLMFFAGLYDCVYLEGEKDPLWTFTIVTTMANREFDWLHERQPVILTSRADIDTWLDTSSNKWTDELTKLVEPFHDQSSPIECYQVPKEVGKVGTESKTFIEPIAKRKDGIQALFSRMKETTPSMKRKRSPSPLVKDISQETRNATQEDSTFPKKQRSNIEDTMEDKTFLQEVAKVMPPAEASTPSKHTKSSAKSRSESKSPGKTITSKKSPKKAEASQKNKITTFFAKAA